MFFPRRKCCVFLKKLLLVFILSCGCVSLWSLLCFDGECGISEEERRALSSLSDVVLEANKPSRIVDRNGQLAEVATFLSPNATTEGILIKIWLITSIFLKHARLYVCGGGEGGKGPVGPHPGLDIRRFFRKNLYSYIHYKKIFRNIKRF